MDVENDVNHPLNILEVLDGVEFPADKRQLISFAEDNDASEDVLDVLQGMPEREYTSITDVDRHVGLLDRLPGQENQWSSMESSDLPDDAEIAMTEKRGSGRV